MLKSKLNHYNRLIIAGERLRAIELFYANQIELSENEEVVATVKQACLDRETMEREKLHVTIEITRQAIDDCKQVVFSEYVKTFTDPAGQPLSCRKEISVQQWADGVIRNEQFYFHQPGLSAAHHFFEPEPETFQKPDAGPSKLKERDIELLQSVRDYLSVNFGKRNSISDLARQAGINRMKLKSGFKELFGTTVFVYLTDMRMQEAKRLLQVEKAAIAEVAESIGYKHPHHFTAAFKKKFGLLPTDMKNRQAAASVQAPAGKAS